MLISATEFKNNIGKYLSLAAKEDILITKNGRQIAKLSAVKREGEYLTDRITGILPDKGYTRESIRAERLRKYESNS